MCDEGGAEDSLDSEQAQEEGDGEAPKVVETDQAEATEAAEDDSQQDGEAEGDGAEAGAVSDGHIHLSWEGGSDTNLYIR